MKAIEFTIPEGYRLSPESTDERIILELEKKVIEKEAKEFLINIFNKMKVHVEPDGIGYVYYDVDGMGTVFEHSVKSAILWVSYTHIWQVFESVFSMNDYEIQLFIKKAVDELLNWKGLTPAPMMDW